jgi:hypothetical protein
MSTYEKTSETRSICQAGAPKQRGFIPPRACVHRPTSHATQHNLPSTFFTLRSDSQHGEEANSATNAREASAEHTCQTVDPCIIDARTHRQSFDTLASLIATGDRAACVGSIYPRHAVTHAVPRCLPALPCPQRSRAIRLLCYRWKLRMCPIAVPSPGSYLPHPLLPETIKRKTHRSNHANLCANSPSMPSSLASAPPSANSSLLSRCACRPPSSHRLARRPL